MIAAPRVDAAQDVLRRALAAYPGKIALACSFGGKGGMVLLDMLMQIDRGVPVYFLDTGLLFSETYDLVARVRERYGIEPVAVAPRLSVAAQAAAYGDELWTMDPDACCALRKLEPQREFLRDYDAWISGVRREQGSSRALVDVSGVDEDGKMRIAPLADWNDGDIVAYLNEHRVPYNALNDRGYPSVGCTFCTRVARPGEDPRAARWPGFAKTECGLHARVTSTGDAL